MTTVSAPLLAVRRAMNAAALTAWLAASLRGGASADDVTDASAAMGLRRIRTGQDSQSVLLALADWRAQGWHHTRLVLPAPADLQGLPGPTVLNRVALEAGVAILLTKPERMPEQCLVLVPGDEEAWTGSLVPLSLSVISDWPSLRHARADFTASIAGHSAALLELDVAGDPRGLREVVLGEDDQPLPTLPPGFADERRALLARARLVAILAATAQADDGTSVSAAEATSRAAHLRSLGSLARRAIAASVSP